MESRPAMAFPFLWIGALTAGLFLTATFVVFWLGVHLLSRTVGEIRGSMLPGLVSGFRDWTEAPGLGSEPSKTPDVVAAARIDPLIEDGVAALTEVVPVIRR
jgi:hypothetical protein